MADILIIKTNAASVAKVLDALAEAYTTQLPSLYNGLGPAFVDDIKTRILTQNGGQWARLSKWVKAKTNPERPLQGAEQYVKYRINGTKLEVYGDTPPEWTLTQHHEGFENTVKVSEKQGDRIVIEIVNPSPLGLTSTPSGKFSWVPDGAPSRTPARQIWPTDRESEAIAMPIYSKWAQKILDEAAAKVEPV